MIQEDPQATEKRVRSVLQLCSTDTLRSMLSACALHLDQVKLIEAELARRQLLTEDKVYEVRLSMKKTYPKHVHLLRMEDKYVAFDVDADAIVDALAVTISGMLALYHRSTSTTYGLRTVATVPASLINEVTARLDAADVKYMLTESGY